MTDEELNTLQAFFLTARPDHTTLSQKAIGQVLPALEELESRRRDASEIEIREVESHIKVRVANQMRKNTQEFLATTEGVLESVVAALLGEETLGAVDQAKLRGWYGRRKRKANAKT